MTTARQTIFVPFKKLSELLGEASGKEVQTQCSGQHGKATIIAATEEGGVVRLHCKDWEVKRFSMRMNTLCRETVVFILSPENVHSIEETSPGNYYIALTNCNNIQFHI